MTVLTYVLVVVALLGTTVVYGTDVYCAIVQRPALEQVDDRTLVMSMGQIHRYGDRRMPIPGAMGGVAAALATVTAALAGEPGAAIASGVAVVCGVVWLILYGRVSAPVNRRLTAAAQARDVPEEARAMQRRWDSVIYARAALQGAAALALIAALIALP